MRFVFVDGYNVVNSWDILKKEKSVSLESARQKLIDILDKKKIISTYDGSNKPRTLQMTRQEYTEMLEQEKAQ